MSFNCPHFIKEFTEYVATLNVESALEVGCQSGEMKDTIQDCDGIDIKPIREDVIRVDILKYKTDEKYGLVFSSGLLEHYGKEKAVDIIKAMSGCSSKYILNYTPNTGCLAYLNNKQKTEAEWKDELDYTESKLAELHEDAGLEVLQTGKAADKWTSRFGPEPSEPYLVYCLATKKTKKKEKEGVLNDDDISKGR